MLYSLRSGHGIAVVPDFIIDADLASGTVVPILEEWRPQPVALHLVTPPGTIRPARVTALIEYLASQLGSLAPKRTSKVASECPSDAFEDLPSKEGLIRKKFSTLPNDSQTRRNESFLALTPPRDSPESLR
jgi:hypothetical protein